MFPSPSGLTTLYHPTPNVKRVHWDSLSFYSQITAETGQEVSPRSATVILTCCRWASTDRAPCGWAPPPSAWTSSDTPSPARSVPPNRPTAHPHRPDAQAEPRAAAHRGRGGRARAHSQHGRGEQGAGSRRWRVGRTLRSNILPRSTAGC